MAETVTIFEIEDAGYYLELFHDPYNKRMRVDDYRGHLHSVVKVAMDFAKQEKLEKIIIKARSEHLLDFIGFGFQLEAVVDQYFLGSHGFFLTKYLTSKRKHNEFWTKEDTILEKVTELKREANLKQPPGEYIFKKVGLENAEDLSALYKLVFPVYPTPIHDSKYLRKTIEEGTIYFAYYYEGRIVSAASAEINSFYKNAELTDCATLPDHRKHGLLKWLLKKLEAELEDQGVFCLYSLARSLSFGMNAALHQLGYQYRGRLTNNCYIYDKLENMNAWVKSLPDC